ncbi:DUF2798 domain-containing protein [Salinimonas marina]|uniref:DUF2798 domain-containing protein n=1 Tax=Salinimonas marina TaxID=2785918 RepID=A0A7S9HDE4_9ALTE|nr:DUF2798 domain-containing protein [Salinimonas marina]QPG06186.1 DUF2798 domain-containing protein [Salinimonas marina]
MLHRTVFAILMSLALSSIMSAWVTYINLGMTAHFLQRWFEAWILAWPAAGVCAFIFGPSVHRLSAHIVARLVGEQPN